MRRLFLNRSEPVKKSDQNIPKNRCRTTIGEQMMETPAELPFIGDQVVCLSQEPGREVVLGAVSTRPNSAISRRAGSLGSLAGLNNSRSHPIEEYGQLEQLLADPRRPARRAICRISLAFTRY